MSLFRKGKKIVGKLPECNSWSSSILTTNDLMIHYYLDYMLVPEISNHSTITDTEMQLLYAIKNNMQVN